MAAPPILVGEANPYGPLSDFALYPDPPNSAGGRLCRLVLGLGEGQYLSAFERMNLCPEAWSAPVARSRAAELLVRVDGGALAVLLGAKVTRACGLAFEPFSHQARGAGRVVVLPHPSGLCRTWQEPGAFKRARLVLHEAGVLPVPSVEAP